MLSESFPTRAHHNTHHPPYIRKHSDCIDVLLTRHNHPQVGAYVLDFPDPASKLSIKNVQLVPATDRSSHRLLGSRQRRRDNSSSSSSRGGINSNNNGGRRESAWGSHSGDASLHPRGRKDLNEEEAEEAEEEENNRWCVAGDEATLLSFGKSDRDSFSLDFGWPLTPMQAFALALAALDTSI